MKKTAGLVSPCVPAGYAICWCVIADSQNLGDQSGSLHQPGASAGLQPLPKTIGPCCPDGSYRHMTEVWMVTCLCFFFSPWKSRFYSDLFKNIWTLSWPCHCGMLIVPSLFQISDPSLLYIMSVSSRDLLGIRIACVCSRTSLGNHKWEGRTLCSSLSCVLLLWGCLPWYLSCHQCYMFTEAFFKEINKLPL